MSTMRVLCPTGHTRAGVIFVVVCAATALAAPPLEPLPAPQYSFDLSSPKVADGSVGASDLLENTGLPAPSPVVPATSLGLLSPYDDLDALSAGNGLISPTTTFMLLFSVDRGSQGDAVPLPALKDAEAPYNALDQADRGHAAGDQYAALDLYTPNYRHTTTRGNDNNTLVRANFNEGGTSFVADPAVHSYEDTSSRVPQDNVDAFAMLPTGITTNDLVNVYFTLTWDSDSLEFLPGNQQPSGAHVFFNPDPRRREETTLYATFAALGLVQSDDIDGLITFDSNGNGLFDSNDAVLYSLTPGSPSLGFIPGTSQAPAADVLISRPMSGPNVFLPATMLGLGGTADNVDALDVYYTDQPPLMVATISAIRSVLGDADDDGDVDPNDFWALPLALTGPDGGPVSSELFMFDGDADDDVDMLDFGAFQSRYTGMLSGFPIPPSTTDAGPVRRR